MAFCQRATGCREKEIENGVDQQVKRSMEGPEKPNK